MRTKRILLLASLASLAACTSTVNQDACKAYVDHLNGLPCRGGESVEAASTCPVNYDGEGSHDCTTYFACLTDAATCDGDTFVNEGVAACTSCEVPE